MQYEIQMHQRKIMSQKIFVFKEYIQRHVLRAVKYLLKNSLENIMYKKMISIYI